MHWNILKLIKTGRFALTLTLRDSCRRTSARVATSLDSTAEGSQGKSCFVNDFSPKNGAISHDLEPTSQLFLWLVWINHYRTSNIYVQSYWWALFSCEFGWIWLNLVSSTHLRYLEITLNNILTNMVMERPVQFCSGSSSFHRSWWKTTVASAVEMGESLRKDLNLFQWFRHLSACQISH